MLTLKIDNKTKNFDEDNLTYYDIVRKLKNEKSEPFLVKVNGVVKELGNKVNDLEEIEFLYYNDKIVKDAYESTAAFIFHKVYNELYLSEDNICLKFRIDNALYFEREDKKEISDEEISKIKNNFAKIVNEKIVIKKIIKGRKEAFKFFDDRKMLDEKMLFKYNYNTKISLRSIDDYVRHINSKTLYDTGYIRYYEIEKYNKGIILLLPDTDDITIVKKRSISKKLFEMQDKSFEWSKALSIDVIGRLNQKISKNEFDNLVILSESVQDKMIGDIAENIYKQKKKIIFVAGPSSSGKTTFSHRLSYYLKAFGLNSHPISCDDFYKNRIDMPVDEKGEYDFEIIEAIDTNLIKNTLQDLLGGKEVEIPKYNFHTGKREKGKNITLKENELIIFEGIHCLNPLLTDGVIKDSIYKIYLSALTSVFINGVNRISTSDLRLIRRITRDNRERGSSAKDTIKRWASVRKGESKSIFPFQDNADIFFNSAFPYEFNILKIYSMPLLYDIADDEEVGVDARRLIKLLNYFLSVNTEAIPKYSIIREFIGGSIINV